MKKGYRIVIEESACRNTLNTAAIYRNFEIIEYLGKYHKDIRSIINLPLITECIRRNTKNVFTQLLKAESGVLISHNVVEAVVGNWDSGKEVIILLLEKQGADVVITEEVVKVAVGNWESEKEVVILLLEKQGADIVITEEVVKAVADNSESGKEVIILLLKK